MFLFAFGGNSFSITVSIIIPTEEFFKAIACPLLHCHEFLLSNSCSGISQWDNDSLLPHHPMRKIWNIPMSSTVRSLSLIPMTVSCHITLTIPMSSTVRSLSFISFLFLFLSAFSWGRDFGYIVFCCPIWFFRSTSFIFGFLWSNNLNFIRVYLWFIFAN